MRKMHYVLLGGFILLLFFPGWALVEIAGGGIQASIGLLVLIYVVATIEFVRGTFRYQLQASHWILIGLALVATLLTFRAYDAPRWQFDPDPVGKAWRQIYYIYTGIAIYLILPYLVRTREDLHFGAKILFVGAAIEMLYGLIELAATFGFAPWFEILDRVARGNPSFVSVPATAPVTLYGIIPRLHFTASEPSYLGPMLILPAALALSAALVGDASKRRVYAALAGGISLCYLLSFSRLGAGMLVVAFGLVSYWALKANRRFPMLVAIAAGSAMVIFTAAVFVATKRPAGPPLPFGSDASIYSRVVSQIIALKVWSGNIWGIGYGLFGHYFQAYVGPYLAPGDQELYALAFANPLQWVPIHNTYLRIATELGIEGIGLMIALWLIIGSKAIRAIRTAQGTAYFFITIGTCAAFGGILVGNLMEDFSELVVVWFLLAFTERAADLLVTPEKNT